MYLLYGVVWRSGLISLSVVYEKLLGVKYGLLNKHEAKMARYWPSSRFFCMFKFMDRNRVMVHGPTKNPRGHYMYIQPSWPCLGNTRFIMLHSGKLSCRHSQKAQVTNNSAGFASSCLLMEQAIYNKINKELQLYYTIPIILMMHSAAGTASLWWAHFRSWNLLAINTAPASWGPRALPSSITHLVVT